MNRLIDRTLDVCLLFLLLLVLAGCPGCPAGTTYVDADQLTYDAIAPEYVAYVSSDVALTPDQKERRFQTVRSWEGRLKEAKRDAPTSDRPSEGQ